MIEDLLCGYKVLDLTLHTEKNEDAQHNVWCTLCFTAHLHSETKVSLHFLTHKEGNWNWTSALTFSVTWNQKLEDGLRNEFLHTGLGGDCFESHTKTWKKSKSKREATASTVTSSLQAEELPTWEESTGKYIVDKRLTSKTCFKKKSQDSTEKAHLNEK